MTSTTPQAGPRVISDTITMIGRNLKHNLRMPVGLIMVVLIPLIFLLVFVYILAAPSAQDSLPE